MAAAARPAPRGQAPMTDTAGLPAFGLKALMERADLGQRGPAPVERWNPPDCGPIDIRIDREGGWHYRGTPIGRERLVNLFATVLRKDEDDYFLVTPVEKLRITVEDVPFIAVEMELEAPGPNQTLVLRTNVGDVVRAGPEHPLRFTADPERGDLKPYVRVRGGLDARLSRPLLYQLVDLASERAGRPGILSGGAFFPFDAEGPAS